MAEENPTLVDRFRSLSSQPVARQVRLLLGLAASIALGISVVDWALTPDYTPLYGELSPSAAAEIVEALELGNVPYEVDKRTGLVGVPADVVRETRLKLASEGLPRTGSAGFEVLNQEQPLGVSSFMEKARYDRALEQELSSSIASLDNVRSARVHLALPKQSAFIRKKNKPAASVLVSLYAGSSLSDRQLAGIVHLVAFSVPGLEAEQVSVVDNNGKLLSGQSGEDDFASTKENFRYTQQLEQRYVERIVEILTPILGVGAVQAQVSADLDFTVVERTSERYEPERSVRSEELMEEMSSDKLAGGIPGTLSNQPPEEAQLSAESDLGGAEGGQPAPSRSSKHEIRNYELDKTISHIRETPGNLRKLTVAVVVDYREKLNAEGEVERLPLSDGEMDEIRALVREAVGFDETRGDRVNVVNASFVQPSELAEFPESSLLEQEWIWRAGKISIAGLGMFLLIYFVVRPLMQASAAPVLNQQALGAPAGAAGAPGAAALPDGAALGEDMVTLGHQGNPGFPGQPAYQQQLSLARSMVEGEPERVASVVKGWVANDG
ncbi:MAG: flagellar M-ring protein FliF [Halioglobus sp.]|nr:flagellar M-ring protein FliF [Halioglobus sp.]